MYISKRGLLSLRGGIKGPFQATPTLEKEGKTHREQLDDRRRLPPPHILELVLAAEAVVRTRVAVPC
jgi:hypothetical protein